jgi:predicted nucleotidyltransferase
MITQLEIEKIIDMAKLYGARKVLLFGSALLNPETAKDIDLAADIPGSKLYGFAAHLEDELKIPVDIVPLLPTNRFVEMITREGKILYEYSKPD